MSSGKISYPPHPQGESPGHLHLYPMCLSHRWIKLWDARVFSTAEQRSASARAAAAEAAAAAVMASSKQKRLRMGGMDLDSSAAGRGGGGSDEDDRGYKGGGKGGAAAADAEPENIRLLREKFGFGWKIDSRVLLFSGPPGMVGIQSDVLGRIQTSSASGIC
jgi:hypothetical protein